MSTQGFEGAKIRISAARSALDDVDKLYGASLGAKQISPELLVGVSQIIEHLRSALDYCAYELYERYGPRPTTRPPVRVYFPVIRAGADWNSVLGKCIPGLCKNRPDLAAMLEGWQVTKTPDNQWLPDLASLAVESKHRQLIPQTRKTHKSLKLSGGSAAVSIGEGASISIGRGASISIGGHVLPGGQTIGVGKHPVGFTGEVAEITWVAFVWDVDGRQVNVLAFLNQAVQGTDQIVEQLSGAIS